ncbi:histone deacetylase family protein [Methylobrevis albus]|uniref:Histone deacetylase family protein n=1 Tax=Methylobrevis albus TaxID=2793297 RepID=A0A931I2J5_9HYPH|nr:histone deacetylase family protein [Methylobrevis albus]MBH0238115.1 histone deacetylase family protein [Methylobrevis albus]
MRTLYLHHPSYLDHVTPLGHPERPDRLRAIDLVLEAEAFQALDRLEAPLAEASQIARAHPASFVDEIRFAVPSEGLVRLDSDTVVSPGSWEAALRASGAACRAVDEVMTGRVDNAFSAHRPPGHHAELATAMGFCLFNHAAVAARHAQAAHGAERVAIVDFDVHHGNGTQDIFWSDASVMYCSSHQMPLFPGTGALSETGVGNIVNAPLLAGDGSDAFREAYETSILPALTRFRPDLVIISAGFDAHHRDPLANIDLTEADFSWVTGKLLDVAAKACGGRVVSLLEGGYDLKGLSSSVGAHVQRLMGH